MTIGLKVDFLWYPIGTDDFFYSFFSTICVNVENSNWGSKFPILMEDLYQGRLPYHKIDSAISELCMVKENLKFFSPNQVVWDFEDRAKLPPWGSNISEDITNLADYFITSDGKNLISVLMECFKEAKLEKVDIEVKKL